ncbi:gluconokinase [Castellaniella hirudinis]|uniref:gluconokinase n=1 Tax=Castellaniella hirudinis TaxID=1144617 RepID=UPI0039C46EA1
MQKIALSSFSTAPEPPACPPQAVVVMGVSGSGKSTVGDMLAQRHRWVFVEGDAFHSEQNHAKMRTGIPLDDEDRHAWLEALGQELVRHAADGVVLSCSALKRAYRQRLRAHVPDLAFIWLEVGRDAAQQRVAGRGASHFFPATLIDSQFAALEPPLDEAGLLHLDSEQALDQILDSASDWLQRRPHASR